MSATTPPPVSANGILLNAIWWLDRLDEIVGILDPKADAVILGRGVQRDLSALADWFAARPDLDRDAYEKTPTHRG